MKNTYTNEYYQKVRELLPEINFKEGRFLRDIKKVLTDYEKTHPKCTYEDLVKEFESPDEVVYNYIAVEGKTYLFKVLKRKKYGKYIAIVIISSILIISMLGAGVVFKSYFDAKRNLTNIKRVEIIEEGTNED